MNNSIFMDILNSRQNLLHKLDGFLLIESFSLDDIIEQLSTLCIFHYKVNVGFRLDDLIELDDIGMPEYFEDTNLSSDSFYIGLLNDFLFLKGFNGNFLLGVDMCS